MNGKRSGTIPSQAHTLFNDSDYNKEVTRLRRGTYGEQKWPAEDAIVSCFNVFSRISSPSSSFYWASVANAPNVLQPYWLTVLPLNVPDLTAGPLL